MTISNKEAALLGLLCEGAKHPYELEKIIEDREMRYWTEISMSSIYKLLRKLENEKYVSSTKKITNENRVTKTYKVTNKGKEAMKEKLREIISSWEKPKRPIDIAMSNLYLLEKNEVFDCFNKYVTTIDEMIKCYKDLKEYLEKHCPISNVQLANRPIQMLQAEKKWIKEFLKEYENETTQTI